MKQLIILIFLSSLLASCQESSRKETSFSNPILAGFYPDPSICRVGDDYYLVNSSFTSGFHWFEYTGNDETFAK